MALGDRLKCLSQHKIEVPPPDPEPVVSFDQAAADELLHKINDELGCSYPPGCLQWIIANRKDIWTALCSGENVVDLAYLNGDMPGFVKALDLLKRMYCKAYEVFNTRPPVIEVQADLGLG
jgi:hypothetical protein